MENSNVCSKKDSVLLLQKRSYLERIPEHLRFLTCKSFNARISEDDIVSAIIELINEQGFVVEDPCDTSTSDDAEDQAINRNAGATGKIRDIDEHKKEHGYVRFREVFGDITKKKCYTLVCSPIRQRSPALSNVACIPWVRVFDFDTHSSTLGLYLWVENNMRKRDFSKSIDLDKTEAPDDNVTNWVSVLGSSGDVDSDRIRNAPLSPTAIWRHGESLTDFCIGRKVPVILVMWYPLSSNLDKTLDIFLTSLSYHLKAKLNSFQCIVCLEQKPNKRTPLYKTLERLELLSSVITVSVETLCEWMDKDGERNASLAVSRVTKTLPKYPEQGELQSSVEIKENDLIWIRNHIYVLVKCSPNPQTTDEATARLSSLRESFLKGGKIDWDLLEGGGCDVERDLLNKVKTHIESKFISTGRTGIITLFHAPGGGGTTFARRLLHELRDLAPCGEYISERFSMRHLVERVTHLRNLTFLPTVLLLDGNSIDDVKQIRAIEAKVRVILIHVRRYIRGSRDPISNDNQFYLDARVSEAESTEFTETYIRSAPNKKNDLRKLLRKSYQTERRPYIFEFGMTAYESEFEGVRRYVHGYLQVRDSGETCNWHVVLLYLSMANYYGHRGLPCKLFGKLLDRSGNEVVEIEDLPKAAQQFITDEDDIWKITHYVVSKLIIEQVLVRRSTTNYRSRDNFLTPDACKELCKWALLFIDNINEIIGPCKKVAPHIYEILTSIFIRRNYDDPGEKETSGSKTQFSKIIQDIGNTDEQKSVFKKLAESFPDQPEFTAHLGRFFSKHGEFAKAEECFRKAIEVRKREIVVSYYGIVSAPEATKPDNVLQRIYNMAGFSRISSIRSCLGFSLGQLAPRKLKGKNMPDLIRFCLQKADECIKCFENGRLYDQKSSNPSFANLGELKVRLQLSELAKHVGEDNFTSLRKRLDPYCDLAEFALQSFHECDRLLAECIADRSRDIDIPEEDLALCMDNFHYFFRNATEALKNWAGKDTSMHSLKCRLSILKAKLKQENRVSGGNNLKRHFRLRDDVKNSEDIFYIVQLCEKICDVAFANNSDMRISSYMMEWLRSIRHRCINKQYSQDEVLARVNRWKKKNEKGSLSNFYCYLLSTTLSICSLSRETANVYAEESHKRREEIKHSDTMPVYGADASEWLGKNFEQGFKRIIHHSELGEWNGKFWNDPEQISRLQVCSGSIQHCRPHDGIIILDGDRDARIPVFFVPHRFGIGLSHSKKRTRVEFYLAFNTRQLAEAYEVRPLKTFPCPNPDCKMPTVITTLGKDNSELCATCNACNSLVTIPDADRGN